MIIDTNVYSAANAGHKVAAEILVESSVVYMPVIVLAELRAGFLGGTKNKLNLRMLVRFLAENNVDVLHIGENTAKQYAELAVFARARGKSLSNNDIWIAALALENGAQLATFDRDFSVFAELLGDDLMILEY